MTTDNREERARLRAFDRQVALAKKHDSRICNDDTLVFVEEFYLKWSIANAAKKAKP